MTPSPPRRPAVIVANSLVARGGVGARAAVFALERLGFPVWFVPTIILPYHPGHGRASRVVVPSEAFAALTRDLAASPWLSEVGGVLIGYLGVPDQAEALAALVGAVKAKNPQATILVDPVLGDADRGLFVPRAVAEAVRDRLAPLADILTPNRFELGWLTGSHAATNEDLVVAARRLSRCVAVTSAFALMRGMTASLLVADRQILLAEHSLVANAPNGPGDLFAALLMAHLLSGTPAERAFQVATAGTFETLARSAKEGADELLLAQWQASFVKPMAMVSLRRLGGRQA